MTTAARRAARRSQKLPMLAVARSVATTWRGAWARLFLLALILFLPASAIEAVLEHFHLGPLETGAPVAVVSGVTLVLLLQSLAELFFQGVVATAVMERRGGQHVGLIQLARSIPWINLLVADFVLVVALIAGLALLVLPAALVVGYLWIVPAVIKIEHRSIVGGFKRAVQLVRGNFWRVFAVFAFFEALTLVADELVHAPLHSILGDFVGALLLDAVLAPPVALAAVLITFQLIDLHKAEAE